MNGMTAKRLRVILSIVMVAIIVVTVIGFTIAQKNLAAYANSISSLNADASSGDKDIRTLQDLKTRLGQEQELIKRTRAVVGDSSTYASTVVDDITRIGSESGIPIKSISFAEDTATTSTPQTSAPTASGPVASGTAAPGVVKKTVAVAIQSPLSYTTLMNFLSKIETNPLRMHVTKVVMTKDKGNNVSTPDLSIEVYVRQ